VGRGVARVLADAGDAAAVWVEVRDFDAHICGDLESDVRYGGVERCVVESDGELKNNRSISVDDQEVILTLLTLKAVEIELVTEYLVDGKVKCSILAPPQKALDLFPQEGLQLGLLEILV
jgi:hypothetical protein